MRGARIRELADFVGKGAGGVYDDLRLNRQFVLANCVVQLDARNALTAGPHEAFNATVI